MSLAVFEDVSLAFGDKTIVEDLNLRIGPADRIGLIGPNGSGKTSLLRLLAGEQAPDGGKLLTRRELRLGYLPQDISVEGGKSLLNFVRDSVQGRTALEDEAARVERELGAAQKNAAPDEEVMNLAERMSALQERIAHYDMHYTEHEAIRILAGLSFSQDDLTRDLSELSGGWRMRAVLASLLYQQPDLLLLDEPTNHLDLPSVAWLTDFLKRYERAFVLICHDREFLNEQVARIVSLEVEGVRQYSGNYEQYLKQRAEEEIILENKAKNIAREREHAERFITRFRAKASKAKAVQSRVKALDRMEEVTTYRKRKVMSFTFPPTGRGSNEPISVRGLAKSYGDHEVFRDVTLTVRRGERIGIIGVNGAGKTTLLRTLAGELEPSAGEIRLGHNTRIGYYAQHHADMLHRDNTVYDEVVQVDPEASVTRVRSVLGAFLFSGDDVEKQIGVLSGGERARVALARLLLKPGNLLMMDEPTNHLDLASSEALAESLDSYDGTLIFVSHNKSFVRKLATRIWNVADGSVETYPGSMDEYMDSCRRRLDEGFGSGTASTADAPTTTEPRNRSTETRAEKKERKRREAEARQAKSKGKQLQERVAELEAQIAELEKDQAERTELLSDPDVYADAERSKELMGAYHTGQTRLQLLTAKWERAQADLDAAD